MDHFQRAVWVPLFTSHGTRDKDKHAAWQAYRKRANALRTLSERLRLSSFLRSLPLVVTGRRRLWLPDHYAASLKALSVALPLPPNTQTDERSRSLFNGEMLLERKPAKGDV